MAVKRLLLLGGGNIGSALLAGWIKKEIPLEVTVVDPSPSDHLRDLVTKPHTLVQSIDALKKTSFDVVVLAVKPQSFPEILPTLIPFTNGRAVFMSVAAGKTMAGMQEILGMETPIIRVMPNTPALIGQGMAGLVANAYVSEDARQLAEDLMLAVGDSVWVSDEEQMHAVTALSGSGPAYVFAMVEAMQKAGEALGLDAETALKLARKTVQGAGALAAEKADTDPSELRRQVTSPGGTTAAALDVLLAEDGLAKLMREAMRAAAKRSQEMA